LGTGGFAKVRKAMHKPSLQLVAIKIILLDSCDV